MRREPLLFERSESANSGWYRADGDMPDTPPEELLPSRYLRRERAALPEVSELEVVRHFTRLSQLNFCIDTHFYPLGSCTMKYNPKVNEKAAQLPGLTQMHPFAPESASQGSLQLLNELQQLLCEICGMSAFSLHAAAGAQGELAGILIARAYHQSRGETRRQIVIPDTAHGTNPASAHLGGYQVVTVKSNARGRTDLSALREAVTDQTALFMLTNPNTLGLFEDDIIEIAEIVHERGALLYLDGANLNALVGVVRPGDLGFDILHLNTHKTFSTPHGGGGPGAGPVGVAAHLAQYLPGWVVERSEDVFRLKRPERSIGLLRAFFGSVGVLVRAYSYIRALGAEGLRRNTEGAVISANYLRILLSSVFRLYVDEPCMHECVLSALAQKKRGARALDVGKRLLDYGFHPPTTYFPLIVEEALMVEPTESETKETLDAFVQALQAIDAEINSNPEVVQTSPHSMPVGRLDEVRAAREPILKWTPQMSISGARNTASVG
ncbi:MAG: aminomethyl-transferring glycine dehydrogenase subunit GcvPB [Armatimonadetes bacterium]|nr:aminomethyl-transferring glycine dehydrogenase subunit GcvPB [Armatimonadota bacterium]